MSGSGFLNLFKPPGMTSHDVVAAVRRLVPRKIKVGHLGTLDPAACGVLPVAVDLATKLIPLAPDLGPGMKGYLGQVRFGLTTTTDDLEGEVLTRGTHDSITEEAIRRTLSAYRGTVMQVPPKVSALRKDGVRAYERARKGQEFELPARPVQIERAELLGYRRQTATARIYLVCGSGTYVRSLARDVGAELGAGGCLSFLIRTHSGPFLLEETSSLEDLQRYGVESKLLPCWFVFQSFPRVDSREEVFQKGQRVTGNFPSQGTWFWSESALFRPTGETGEAVVEALFERVRERE